MQKDYEREDQKSKGKEEGTPEIRVTDRRRISLRDNRNSGESAGNVAEEGPRLKPSYVEELEARTKAAEKLVNEVQIRFEQLRDQLQREMDETRQRLNRSADERAQREKAEFIATMLPVLDNLRRATEADEQGSSMEVIMEGVRRTAATFENALTLAGVEPLESIGQAFDPQLHEAVDTAEVEPEMQGKIVAEYARGYKIGDSLLRPARVRVGRAAQTLSQVGDTL